MKNFHAYEEINDWKFHNNWHRNRLRGDEHFEQLRSQGFCGSSAIEKLLSLISLSRLFGRERLGGMFAI